MWHNHDIALLLVDHFSLGSLRIPFTLKCYFYVCCRSWFGVCGLPWGPGEVPRTSTLVGHVLRHVVVYRSRFAGKNALIFSARLLRPGTSLQTVHSPERYIVHLKYSADLDCSAPCLANSTGNRKPSHLVVVAFYCHLVSKKKGIRRWATETEIIYFHFVGKLAQYRFWFSTWMPCF